jgi:2,5-diketo-D-gluconate reductase A
VKESKVPRSEVFIVSKTGPGATLTYFQYYPTTLTYYSGGLSWPLGYNETIAQAEAIVANYSSSYVDLLLIHWPVNYGPCSYKGPKPSIPTTDPLCDTALPTYSPKGCRLSTWRAMLTIWKQGLARAVGVSNFNSTHLQEIADANLPMPSVNQCQFSPDHGLHAKGCTPGSEAETCGELLKYCKDHGVVFNGYSPYGGKGGAGKLLADPRLARIAQAHGTGPAQVVLSWQWRLGVLVNPEAQKQKYQIENLDFFNFTLSDAEMTLISDQW